jgi:hypothetical protein
MATNEFVKQLNEQQWFQTFIEKEVAPDMPQVPSFDPSSDNTERWKYDSAMREGYRLALLKFGVRLK